VLRNASLESIVDKNLVASQIDLMQDTVNRQLARVVVTAPTIPNTQVDVSLVVRKIVRTLEVAFPNIDLLFEAHTQAQLLIDEGDLLEVLGNVMENACKYGKYSVRIIVHQAANTSLLGRGIEISVEDDGQGIPQAMREEVLDRGSRLDTQQSGQGIGLAVAKELVTLYQGAITIADSNMGGAKISLFFPLKG
jgi:two-component system sensor histidine kinase PhoQ